MCLNNQYVFIYKFFNQIYNKIQLSERKWDNKIITYMLLEKYL